MRVIKNNQAFYGHYLTQADDSISGTTLDRPDFKRMIQDVEKDRVNMVITKVLKYRAYHQQKTKNGKGNPHNCPHNGNS